MALSFGLRRVETSVGAFLVSTVDHLQGPLSKRHVWSIGRANRSWRIVPVGERQQICKATIACSGWLRATITFARSTTPVWTMTRRRFTIPALLRVTAQRLFQSNQEPS